MEDIIVGIIVFVALAFSLRGLARIYQGKGGCGCGSTCGCSGKDCQGRGVIGKQQTGHPHIRKEF